MVCLLYIWLMCFSSLDDSCLWKNDWQGWAVFMWLYPVSFSTGRSWGGSFMTQDNLKPQLGTCPPPPPPPLPPLPYFNFFLLPEEESPFIYIYTFIFLSPDGQWLSESRPSSSDGWIMKRLWVCSNNCLRLTACAWPHPKAIFPHFPLLGCLSRTVATIKEKCRPQAETTRNYVLSTENMAVTWSSPQAEL